MAVFRYKTLLNIVLFTAGSFLVTSCSGKDYSDFLVRGEVLSISKKHVVIQGDDSVMFLPIDDHNKDMLNVLTVGADITLMGEAIRERQDSGYESRVYDVKEIVLPEGRRISFR